MCGYTLRYNTHTSPHPSGLEVLHSQSRTGLGCRQRPGCVYIKKVGVSNKSRQEKQKERVLRAKKKKKKSSMYVCT